MSLLAAPPPVRADASVGDNRALLVIVAGLGTTALALAGVFAADRAGENIMGWYADFVIPAGALLVGVAASSGYGIAGWKLHCKITGSLLWTVVVLTAGAYFAAQYIEYRLNAPPIGFFRYFDFMTRSFHWQEHGTAGEALGALGYGLRALELAGFVGGGLIAPAVLRTYPYCDKCHRYKDRPLVAMVPGGAEEEGRAVLASIFSLARGDSYESLARELADKGSLANRRVVQKRNAHMRLKLVHCPRCLDGALAAELVVRRKRQVQVSKLGEVPLSPVVVAEFVKRK